MSKPLSAIDYVQRRTEPHIAQPRHALKPGQLKELRVPDVLVTQVTRSRDSETNPEQNSARNRFYEDDTFSVTSSSVDGINQRQAEEDTIRYVDLSAKAPFEDVESKSPTNHHKPSRQTRSPSRVSAELGTATSAEATVYNLARQLHGMRDDGLADLTTNSYPETTSGELSLSDLSEMQPNPNDGAVRAISGLKERRGSRMSNNVRQTVKQELPDPALGTTFRYAPPPKAQLLAHRQQPVPHKDIPYPGGTSKNAAQQYIEEQQLEPHASEALHTNQRRSPRKTRSSKVTPTKRKKRARPQHQDDEEMQDSESSQRGPNRTSQPNRPPAELDYPFDELIKLDFQNLQAADFDASPTTPDYRLPKPHSTKPLPVQLAHVATLPADEQTQFLAALPLTRWEEAGTWFAERFADVTTRLARTRAARRRVALEFEAELRDRHGAVVGFRAAVDAELEGIRRGGERLLQTSTPPGKVVRREARGRGGNEGEGMSG